MRTPIILALGAAAAAGALVWAALAGPAAAGPAGAASPARAAQPVTVYAASGSGTVIPIRAATNTALKAIKVGRLPAAIAITAHGQTAYVVNETSGTVTPIRIATNTAGKPIKVGNGAFAIAITPDGRTRRNCRRSPSVSW